MLHELRTLITTPGAADRVVAICGEVEGETRGDGLGRLEGCWTSEIGRLNRVYELRRLARLDERPAEGSEPRDARRRRLAGLVVGEEVRMLSPFLPFVRPDRDGNVYEYRRYRTRPGLATEWCRRYAEIIPVRARYSTIVCAWRTEIGEPDEVSHLWCYRDLAERAARRAEAATDPAWMAFAEISFAMVEEMHATILIPAAHSPLG